MKVVLPDELTPSTASNILIQVFNIGPRFWLSISYYSKCGINRLYTFKRVLKTPNTIKMWISDFAIKRKSSRIREMSTNSLITILFVIWIILVIIVLFYILQNRLIIMDNRMNVLLTIIK